MESDAESQLLARLTQGVGLHSGPLEMSGEPTLESWYPVSELAASAVGVAGLAAAELSDALGFGGGPVRVDRALADAWFGAALRPIGWELPSPWDPIAGDYRAHDVWIRLHTNAPNHRMAALRVLGTEAERDAVARAVSGWDALELENAVVAEGGCAAELRTPEEWALHPQGAAVAAEPLVNIQRTNADAAATLWAPTAASPLAGLRVLDLTRVLAGPVATRFLAGLGAEVLRIDPLDWDEPAIVPEMTLGKRTARLDARDPGGLARLEELLAEADVLVSGYRSDALERLGLGEEVRRGIRPGLVDVSLDAYGHTGPWADRRGFDSLVQMSSGIAGAGLFARSTERTTPLPVQALDHATGYLVAAAVLAALRDRVRDGRGTRSRLSLARTAVELQNARGFATAARGAAPNLPDTAIGTHWGPASLLDSPVRWPSTGLRWDRPPRPLGSDPASWS
ncbi:MAG: CoA transferase [Actinomycetota bacterium]|nr:CoA transferase [Actinomycetota bacterium]